MNAKIEEVRRIKADLNLFNKKMKVVSELTPKLGITDLAYMDEVFQHLYEREKLTGTRFGAVPFVKQLGHRPVAKGAPVKLGDRAKGVDLEEWSPRCACANFRSQQTNKSDKSHGQAADGKTAMTGAERVRRWREKHAVAKPSKAALAAEVERLTAENERLRARARPRRLSISTKASALTYSADVLTKQKQKD